MSIQRGYCIRLPFKQMTSVNDMATAMVDTSLAEIIRDFGYAFTSSIEECKNHMLNFGAREPSPEDVAKITSMMVRCHATVQEGPQMQTPGNFWVNPETKKDVMPHGHGESWNPEVFVQTLKELTPNLNWKEVILHLDNVEFIVPDRQGLHILFSILRLGLQSAGYPANIFPVDYLCRRWTNLEGQMSLISNILKNPDIFSFADHPFHTVSIDLLKTHPEADSKEVSTWRCLHLVDLLLYAAEHGYYVQVNELLKFPLQHCPDILLLVVLQINSPMTTVRQELLTTLTQIFLANHQNSGIILNYSWHTQNPNVRSIMMHAMVNWYNREECDQAKLSRILDVAQDLKALTLLLNVQSFHFTIDLACLASRREYLKLDKWLTDKILEHGEPFLTAMVKFLQRRCPIIAKKPEETLPKATQLLPETVTTMLTCLQMCIRNVSLELQEMILNLHTNCQTFLMNKSRPLGLARPQMRVFDTVCTPSLSGQIIAPQPGFIDSINNLIPNMANINLNAPTNTTFAMAGTICPLEPAPNSARLMEVGHNSPFTMLPMPHTPNITYARKPLTPAMEKPRIPENAHYSEVVQDISKEIEEEANSYFRRIYNQSPHSSLSVEEVLEKLKKFQDSPNKRDYEVFSHMLRNLFEEYKFFSQYPDKELEITAQLFGGIIERGLVPSFISLSLALKFVLDALRKPIGSKMYNFAITALDRFKLRLKEFHTYCEHIRAIPHFSKFPEHLIEYVEYGRQNQEPPIKAPSSIIPNQNNGPNVTPFGTGVCASPSVSVSEAIDAAGPSASRPSIANNTSIDILLTATDKEEKITAPPEAVQDKTAFIFNNLSQLNLQTKCEELKEIITEEYYPWLSQYLVMKRASIELNFHALYALFIDVLKIREVILLVTKETYRNIKVLLRSSDKCFSNFSDRSLLKNLGHWLGMITLGRNVPILHLDLDLKALLLEAYHKGQEELLYVVPFIAKILESCAKSFIFKPPNPWTMSLISTLAELHQESDLKLTLKFEIEVLCKALNLEITEIKPLIYLKDPERLKQINFQLSQPKLNTEVQGIPIGQTPVMNHQIQMAPPQPALIESGETGASAAMNALKPSDASFMEVIEIAMPKFNYLDLNDISTFEFEQKIHINPHVPLIQTFPHLKEYVKLAIEQAIREWIHPVVERSIKNSLTTCQQLIKKDFALDNDEERMRTCAHHMMRSLTAAMALVTCREQVMDSINSNLKNAFLSAVMPATSEEVIKTTAAVLAADNTELACALIQKTAVEKAMPEIDKRLMSDYENRKIARQEGTQYFEPMVLSTQEGLPERLRLRLGCPTEAQMQVYDAYARCIPGFLPMPDAKILTPKEQDPFHHYLTYPLVTPHVYGADEMTALINAAEIFISRAVNTASLAPQISNMHSLLDYLLLAKKSCSVISGNTLLQKAVEGLLDAHVVQPGASAEHREMMLRYRDIHLRVLKLLEDARVYGHMWTTKQITSCIVQCREELRYNVEAIDCLIRNNLVNFPEYDIALAHMMDNGNNYMAVHFGMQLVQLYLVDKRNYLYVGESDLRHTTEMLSRIISHSKNLAPEGLAPLVELLQVNQDPLGLSERSSLGPTVHFHSGMSSIHTREYNDPPGFQEKVENVLRDWRNIIMSPITEIKLVQNFNVYVHRMGLNDFLKSEELITRFFRIGIQICISSVYQQFMEERLENPTAASREKYYIMCDSFVKLTSLLIKNIADVANPTPKLNLLNKVLGLIVGCLVHDHKNRCTSFRQLPYHRLILILFLDMTTSEPILESISYQTLVAFCNALRFVRPTVAPGFCFSWLEIISHRTFIYRALVVSPDNKGWGLYANLLTDLFKYLYPFLRNPELAPPVMAMYKGTLKLMLLLLHDFPEFVGDHYYGFCMEIPLNCIQLRNVILSAYPRRVRMPDPFTSNLKVDLLEEIMIPPRILVNHASLIPPQFRNDLDAYLKVRAPVTFLSELRSNMQVLNEPGRRYDIQLMTAVVLYVGIQAISHITSNGQAPNITTVAHSAHMDIFQNFTVDFDYEGRYIFLSILADQLRFPSSHTHYFSCCLLYLFAEANCETVQEQITRVLLERLLANRPHPWGLLVTFLELIKNPVYKFWSHDFVHCDTDPGGEQQARPGMPVRQKVIEKLIRSFIDVDP